MKKIFYIILFIMLTLSRQLAAEELKKADLAGAWYPADKKELAGMLEGFMGGALAPSIEGRVMGMVSPHAGYAFSGRAAGFGYKAVRGAGYRTVVLIGFTHRKFFNGISVYDRGVFQTPLGKIGVDGEFAKDLLMQDKRLQFYPDLFNDENSVEMLIPFVQLALKGAKIVPIAFGPQDYASCELLAKALADTIKDREDVLIIASTDMSHFHTYDEANAIDNFTIRKLQEFDPKGLYEEIKRGASELCGTAPVITLMLAMKMLGAENIKVLKYENSGDVTGDKGRVVGYMSAVFYKSKFQIPNSPAKAGSRERDKSQINSPASAGSRVRDKSQISNSKTMEAKNNMLNAKQRKRLLEIARTTIEGYVKTGKAAEFTETDPELLKEKGAFVTLHYKGELRGCIGNIIGRGPLSKTVRDMAVESSANDPRFPPVTAGELKDIKVEISVLSEPKRETDANKIIMGTHGVIIKRGSRSGVFLPQVATETGWGREEFLSNLCAHKAGLPADAWKDPATEIYTFTAEVFGED